ncbi:MAG TPA: hypothetical protein EYF98_10680, partial [Planctomycetes bacterium]|nr:hypothetical protein [Planctomycetota bacterium]
MKRHSSRGRRAVADKLARIWKLDARRDPSGVTQPAIYALAVNVLIPATEVTYRQLRKSPWQFMGLLNDPKIDRRREKLLMWFHREFWRMGPLVNGTETIYESMHPWLKEVVKYLLANKVDLNQVTWSDVIAPLKAAQAQKLARIPAVLQIDAGLVWRTTKNLDLIMEIGHKLNHCYKQSKYAQDYFLTPGTSTSVLFDDLEPVAALTVVQGEVTEFRGAHNTVAPEQFYLEARALVLHLVPGARDDFNLWGEAKPAAPEDIQESDGLTDWGRDYLNGAISEVENMAQHHYGSHDFGLAAYSDGDGGDFTIYVNASAEASSHRVREIADELMREAFNEVAGGNFGGSVAQGVQEALEAEIDEEALEGGIEMPKLGRVFTSIEDFVRDFCSAARLWDPIEAIKDLVEETDLYDNFSPPGNQGLGSGHTVEIYYQSDSLDSYFDDDWDSAARALADDVTGTAQEIVDWMEGDFEEELGSAIEESLCDLLGEVVEKYLEFMEPTGLRNSAGRRQRRGRSNAKSWLEQATRGLRQGFAIEDSRGNRAMLRKLHAAEKQKGRRGIRVKQAARR